MKCDWRTEKLGYLNRKVLTGNFAEPIVGGWQVGAVQGEVQLLCSRWLSPFLDFM